MKQIQLPDHTRVPALGMGTWCLGDKPHGWGRERDALVTGIRAGMTLIDTAEMYGSGRAERLTGEAIVQAGVPREALFVVSKVYPHNASREGILHACQRSLQRLGLEDLDLYLLHWRGGVPLAETVDGMEELAKRGWIRRWGVSNFDLDDMEELWSVPCGSHCATNQVLYHLGSRGIEFDLLPWLRVRGVVCMAYCPLAQGGRVRRMDPPFTQCTDIAQICAEHDITLSQLLLAFCLRDGGVCAIPQSNSPAHMRENARAATIQLPSTVWDKLDAIYWPPSGKMHLDIE